MFAGPHECVAEARSARAQGGRRRARGGVSSAVRALRRPPRMIQGRRAASPAPGDVRIGVDEPGERLAEIRLLIAEACNELVLVGPRMCVVISRVASTKCCACARRSSRRRRIERATRGRTPERLEHRQAPGFTAEQALVDERRDHIDASAGDGLRRAERASTGEDTELCKQALLRRVEQVVAPPKAERSVRGAGSVTNAADEQRQSPSEPDGELVRRQSRDPRRSELDRKRKAVERSADLPRTAHPSRNAAAPRVGRRRERQPRPHQRRQHEPMLDRGRSGSRLATTFTRRMASSEATTGAARETCSKLSRTSSLLRSRR